MWQRKHLRVVMKRIDLMYVFRRFFVQIDVYLTVLGWLIALVSFIYITLMMYCDDVASKHANDVLEWHFGVQQWNNEHNLRYGEVKIWIVWKYSFICICSSISTGVIPFLFVLYINRGVLINGKKQSAFKATSFLFAI